MIEEIRARNGSVVLRQAGRLLASAIDPEAEARDWVARRSAFLKDIRYVFVLGAGSGYHIAELAKSTGARILVIEQDENLIRKVLSVHSFDVERVEFVSVKKASQLRAHEGAREGVKQSFLVLRYGPSQIQNQAFYRECQNLLLGRNWGSLNWQWQLQGHAAFDRELKIDSRGEELTIYDLDATELVQNSEERERMLIKALRELVK